MASDSAATLQAVPRFLASFVGRARETAEICALLTTARLFTLTGAGGSGKTRLAAHVSTQIQPNFRDGVCWVDLNALTDPALLPDTVAACCGVTDRDSPTLLDALVSALRPRNILLVLDNCERLLLACAQIAERLLTSCPELHILTTSREAFSIPGEVIWYVPPLKTPAPDTDLTVAALATVEAVELLVARASSVVPGFQVTPDNAPAVARICQRVEGLPLALELAAARLRSLSVVDLANQLDDACRVLTGGSRTATSRQQTLRATLDWSHDLLSEQERAVFAGLAVFAGGFSLEAAEQVCADDELAPAGVLQLLSHLVEQSLVTVQDHRDLTRYRLLEPIRQYAHAHLSETGTIDTVQRRHRDWYAAWVGRARLFGPEQGHWLDRFAAEHDNLRAALTWSLSHDPVVAGHMVLAIWQFWLMRGHLREGRGWLDRILTALPDNPALRAELHWIAGILARPDAAQAEQHFLDSLAICRRLGIEHGVARALSSLGFLAQATGDHPRAVAFLEQSLPILRGATLPLQLANVLISLAISVAEAGNPAEAATLCTEGLTIFRDAGDPRGTAAALANLGLIALASGNPDQALPLLEESLTHRRQVGDHGGQAHVLTVLGDLAVARGAIGQALAQYQEALVFRRQMGEHDGLPPLLEGLAAVAVVTGTPERAVQLAGAAAALRATLGVRSSTREQRNLKHTLTLVRTRLGPKRFTSVWEAGRQLTLDQAVKLATTLQHDQAETPPAPSQGDAHPVAETPLTTSTFGLTPRESEVLRHLVEGLTYAQIAEQLVVSPRTVDAHIRAIFAKLNARSRTAVTRIALQHHLV